MIELYLCSYFFNSGQIKIKNIQIEIVWFIIVNSFILLTNMGNSNSQESSFDYILDHWEPYQLGQNVQIMRNMDDGRLAERKDIFLDVQYTYQNDADIYKLRKQNKFNLVQVYAIQKKVNNNKISSVKICNNKCTQFESFQILTEYIVKRLDEIQLNNLKQFLYSFLSCLIGFRKINSIFGKIKITLKMIGMNYKSQLKVWVNQNFAENMPQCEMPDDEKGDEEILIRNLFELLQSRCRFTYEELFRFKQQFQPFSKFFRTAIRLVQTYIEQNDLQITFLPSSSKIDGKKPEINQFISEGRQTIKSNVNLNNFCRQPLRYSNNTFNTFQDAYGYNSKTNISQVNETKSYQKRSPYMKLNLMQSFAKSQPKFNQHSQFQSRVKKESNEVNNNNKPYNFNSRQNGYQKHNANNSPLEAKQAPHFGNAISSQASYIPYFQGQKHVNIYPQNKLYVWQNVPTYKRLSEAHLN